MGWLTSHPMESTHTAQGMLRRWLLAQYGCSHRRSADAEDMGWRINYGPVWLHTLEGRERDEVVYWLQDNGIDPDICAGFDVALNYLGKPMVVSCRMYRTEMTRMGLRPVVDHNADFLYDDERVFVPKWWPRALEVTHHLVPPIESDDNVTQGR